MTPRAIETGGYEASVRRVHVNSGRRMIETAMELLGEIVQTDEANGPSSRGAVDQEQ